jgi:hypothetical protein
MVLLALQLICATTRSAAHSYTVVGTAQTFCYDARSTIQAPVLGRSFYGQDAQHPGPAPTYRDNGDATVSDLVTGLMWQQDPGPKVAWDQAVAGAATCTVGGHSDWRMPTIKELYSLILFSGVDAGPVDAEGRRPFIDTRYFRFRYGRGDAGERVIDSQFWSGTLYTGTTMGGVRTAFGVNFADGRIKGYGLLHPGPGGGRLMREYTLYVRGNPSYGRNQFRDLGNGTVEDQATGLMWTKNDTGVGMDWPASLAAANKCRAGGYSDWRLPNAKELQSIVDYSRSPDASSSAAIDPVFNSTPIRNEAGQPDWPTYWTSTTHVSVMGGGEADNVSFGRGMGFMALPPTFEGHWIDVHGAGCQRCDPKVGSPANYPWGRGPQGDAVRINNFVRFVRG